MGFWVIYFFGFVSGIAALIATFLFMDDDDKNLNQKQT